MTYLLRHLKALILMIFGVMVVSSAHAEQYLMYEVRTDGRKTMVHPRATVDPSRHETLISQLCRGGGVTAIEIRRGDAARIRDKGEEPRLVRVVQCGNQSLSVDELNREVAVVARECRANHALQAFSDCDCVVKRFPELRSASPTGHHQTEAKRAAGLCIDPERMRSTFYQRCADMMKSRDPGNYQNQCNCIANRGVENFLNNRRSADSFSDPEITKARNDAMRQCAR